MGGEGFEPPKECLQLIYSQSPLATWVTAPIDRTVAGSQARCSTKDQSARQPVTEPTMGIEPITYHLQGGCSTIELRRRPLDMLLLICVKTNKYIKTAMLAQA